MMFSSRNSFTPCFLAGVLFLSTSLLGQEKSENDIFSAFFNLGASSSQLSGDKLSGFDQIGVAGGVGIELDLEGDWKPRMELLFIQKGSRKNARPDDGDFESYLLRLNYVEVPLTLGYTRGSTGFELGLGIAYLLNSSEEDENGTIPGIDREFENYDFSGLLGIRYAFHERWELGTRFNQSILPVRDHSGASTFRLNRGQYNTSMQFLLRFRV